MPGQEVRRQLDLRRVVQVEKLLGHRARVVGREEGEVKEIRLAGGMFFQETEAGLADDVRRMPAGMDVVAVTFLGLVRARGVLDVETALLVFSGRIEVEGRHVLDGLVVVHVLRLRPVLGPVPAEMPLADGGGVVAAGHHRRATRAAGLQGLDIEIERPAQEAGVDAPEVVKRHEGLVDERHLELGRAFDHARRDLFAFCVHRRFSCRMRFTSSQGNTLQRLAQAS